MVDLKLDFGTLNFCSSKAWAIDVILILMSIVQGFDLKWLWVEVQFMIQFLMFRSCDVEIDVQWKFDVGLCLTVKGEFGKVKAGSCVWRIENEGFIVEGFISSWFLWISVFDVEWVWRTLKVWCFFEWNWDLICC